MAKIPKQESGLTAVWLKWDPPVFSLYSEISLTSHNLEEMP